MTRDQFEHESGRGRGVLTGDPERMAALVDGSIGEASPFHNTFCYYAQAEPWSLDPQVRAVVDHRIGGPSARRR